jgi:hypothetical protein
MTPGSQPEPPAPPGLAVFFITGDGTSIHWSPQNAAGGGDNVSVTGPATVAGPRGRAVSGPSVQAGRDATATRAGDQQPPKRDWWARLRERGVVATIAIIIGAIATVIGTAVAICAWTGWSP